MSRNHIVISGTGRAGTSFLVELLTHLGLDTGFAPADLARNKDEVARAGFEFDIRDPLSPHIVKSPWFCDYAEEVFQRSDIRVEHLFVPMRDITAAAESRRQVQERQIKKLSAWRRLRTLLGLRRCDLAGGLVHTSSQAAGSQEAVLQGQFYQLILAATTAEVPTTFLRFPRLVRDPAYLFAKLRPALGEISYADFLPVFEAVAKPKLVNRFSAGDH